MVYARQPAMSGRILRIQLRRLAKVGQGDLHLAKPVGSLAHAATGGRMLRFPGQHFQ